MKIFTSETKVNFIDENNVLVGYNTAQDCCEDAGWIITKTIPTSIDDKNINNHNFDDFVFTDIPPIRNNIKQTELDEGGSVTFEIVNSNGDNIYLTLYNSHNGYYCHGFTYTKNDNIIMEDCL